MIAVCIHFSLNLWPELVCQGQSVPVHMLQLNVHYAGRTSHFEERKAVYPACVLAK